MRRKLLPFVLGGALSVATVAPAAAAPPENLQIGGAAGLVAAVVQLQVNDVDVDVLNNALNNALRNADIEVTVEAANNILQNADIDVTIENVLVNNGVITIDVLSGPDIIVSP